MGTSQLYEFRYSRNEPKLIADLGTRTTRRTVASSIGNLMRCLPPSSNVATFRSA